MNMNRNKTHEYLTRELSRYYPDAETLVFFEDNESIRVKYDFGGPSLTFVMLPGSDDDYYDFVLDDFTNTTHITVPFPREEV